jgi:hypothetical protein
MTKYHIDENGRTILAETFRNHEWKKIGEWVKTSRGMAYLLDEKVVLETFKSRVWEAYYKAAQDGFYKAPEDGLKLKAHRQIVDEAGEEESAAPSPPRLAEFLVGLCAGRGARRGTQRGRGRALADATLDDLQDLFERDCEKVGVKRARMRYWAAALRSSWPFLRVALGRLMAAAGLLKVGAGLWKFLSGG